MGDESQRDCYIGFDLGGTKMMAVVYDRKFNALGRKRKKTKNAENGNGLDRIGETIEEALDDAKVSRERIAGVGVGSPGPLDLDKGIILETPNLGWKNVELKAFLERKFKCPAVIGNDVDVGTYGEYRFGAGQKERCVLGIFPGTGIGGGCVYEGKILRGKKGSCLEIGHMQMILTGGRLCGCGQKGCLETISSRLAISADCAMAVFRGEAPNLQKLAGTDLANIRSGVLHDAIEAGDKVVEQIVRNAAKMIGIAAANVTNLLAPDVIVLGGGLVEALEKIFVEEVSRTVAKRAMGSFAKTTEVRAAKLGDDAGALGAAALIADTLKEK
jgi:glucokinase